MPRRLQHAQGVVEFGLIIAAAAIVSIAGVSAMTRAQESYWGAATPTFAAPTPSTGTFLHPTSVDPSTCTPNPWPINTTLTCTSPTVHDLSADPAPPAGTLNWYLDVAPSNVTPFATCSLVPTANGSSCTPATFTPPTDLWLPLVGTSPKIIVKYEIPQSNHGVSQSQPPYPSLAIVPQIVFNGPPNCGGASNQVEIGSPITCTVSLGDGHGNPKPNVDVTWTISGPGSSGTGDSFLSCATGGVQANFAGTLWDISGKCTPGTALTCKTAASGQCSVIYRRIRGAPASSPDPIAGDQQLTVSMIAGTRTSGTIDWPGSAIHLMPVGASKHITLSWLTCTADPMFNNVVPVTNPLAEAPVFAVTSDVFVQGTTGAVLCTATIIDDRHSTAIDCSSGPPPSCTAPVGDPDPVGAVNPDTHEAHSPVGTVTWYVHRESDPIGVQTPIAGSTCMLFRRDFLPPQFPPNPTLPQAPNQTPYASGCDSPVSLPLTGNPATGERVDLFAAYSGSLAHTAGLDHGTVFTFHD